MITTRSDLDRVQRIGGQARYTQLIRGVSACKGVQALAPPGSQKKVWDKKKSPLSICLSIYLSTNNKLWASFENKTRDIFL